MFDKTTVEAVTRETEDSVVVSLNVPSGKNEDYKYIQGQNLTLIKDIDGEEVRRSYSICSSVNDDDLRVGIKKVDGGKFSTWANTHLKPGETLGILPPAGHFYTELDPKNAANYIGVAAGSGITPILSILKTILQVEPESHFMLIYGNKRTDTIMFLEEIEGLKSTYKERFSVFNILSQEIQNADVLNGRIDNEKIEQLLASFSPNTHIDNVFLCGPFSMVKTAEQAFVKHGIDAANIHSEIFGAPTDLATEAPKKQLSKEEAENESRVVIMLDGKGTQLKLARGGETILDAALKVRKELPFACKGGVCATCKAKVVSGEVEMDLNYSLTQEEIDQGFTLTCQAHPVSDDVQIDFDQK